LLFEKTLIEHNIDPVKNSATISFPFKAASDVKVTKITPSCGCLTSPDQKKEWKKGEQGSFTFTLDTSDISGEKVKSIELEFQNHDSQKLSIKAFIPVAILASRQSHIWYKEDALDSKKFIITIKEEYDFTLESVAISNDAFQVVLEKLTEEGVTPKIYSIDVTPPHTHKKEVCVINLQTSSEIDRYKTYKILAVKQ